MKKRYVLIMIIGLIGGLTGCQSENVNNEQVDESVKVIINENPILEVEGVVTTTQNEELHLNFPTTIKAIHVQDGQIVSKGTPLFTFDFSEYNNTIKFKEQEIAILQAELKQLQQESDPLVVRLQTIKEEINNKEQLMNSDYNTEIKVLNNKLIVARQELETLKDIYNTNKQLNEVGGIARENVDQSYRDVQVKEKEIENLTLEIEKIKQDTESIVRELKFEKEELESQLNENSIQLDGNIEIKQLQIKQAQMELDVLKDKYNSKYIEEDNVIAATDNLMIYDIECTVGSKISNSGQMLAKIRNVEAEIVTIDIPIENLLDVQIGNQVVIEAYDNQKEVITGQISRISNRAVEVDQDSVVKADVTITQGVELLKIGSQVDAIIYLEN